MQGHYKPHIVRSLSLHTCSTRPVPLQHTLHASGSASALLNSGSALYRTCSFGHRVLHRSGHVGVGEHDEVHVAVQLHRRAQYSATWARTRSAYGNHIQPATAGAACFDVPDTRSALSSSRQRVVVQSNLFVFAVRQLPAVDDLVPHVQRLGLVAAHDALVVRVKLAILARPARMHGISLTCLTQSMVTTCCPVCGQYTWIYPPSVQHPA